MIKYALFNEETGTYDFHASIEDAVQIALNKKAEKLMEMCPISVVEFGEDGSETWKNCDGAPIDNLSEKLEIAKLISIKYDWVQ